MKMEIIVALIAAGATVLTIIGSIVAVKVTSNSQIKEQKIAADREMKRKYYNAFIEAFTKKLFYINKPDCMEKIEAEMTFVLEANRLPLYASEEMIQFIERIKNPQIAKETKCCWLLSMTITHFRFHTHFSFNFRNRNQI